MSPKFTLLKPSWKLWKKEVNLDKNIMSPKRGNPYAYIREAQRVDVLNRNRQREVRKHKYFYRKNTLSN